MPDPQVVIPARLLRTDSRPIFLSPCHHLLQALIRAEVERILPKYGACFTSDDSGTVSLLTAQCHQCSCEAGPTSRVVWIMVTRKHFNKLPPTLPKMRKRQLCVILSPPFGIYDIDFSGHRVVAYHLYRHIILQEAMSWLSTLGGGFSSLGEKFEDAAEIAGEISLRQMYLALSMKIPVFQARCRLFYAQSLMQRGRLKAAISIIRDVYSFSKSASHLDNPPEVHLGSMCRGLWSRLSHLWSLQQAKKQLSRRFRQNSSAVEFNAMLSTKPNPRAVGDASSNVGRRLFPDIAAVLEVL
uniref:Foie-gras_1 domain-containing protein n=1 Tax=Mesocestoides corti TaxID=53468 RepID=A0A5K3EZG5_MESCO